MTTTACTEIIISIIIIIIISIINRVIVEFSRMIMIKLIVIKIKNFSVNIYNHFLFDDKVIIKLIMIKLSKII